MSVTDEKETTDADSLREELDRIGPWYSPIDFGNGVITRGKLVQRRFARRIKLMQIPEDLTGKRVLDIGAYDGFFSFEFERRGAEVLSIDVWTDLNFEKFQFARKKKTAKSNINGWMFTTYPPRRWAPSTSFSARACTLPPAPSAAGVGTHPIGD